MKLVRHLASLALTAILPLSAGVPQGAPKIYADFDIVQAGTTSPHLYFTIELDRPCAPAAVANFLGLVTGARPWIDADTGSAITEPFYDGTQIYKVIPNGEVSFGSPANDGTGGPGYVFQDESLGEAGDGPYYAYMENNGPNTNGSRFFISIPTQQLNQSYTRLGVVQTATMPPGQNGRINIRNLSNVARDSNTGKPLNDYVIESINIRGWSPGDPTFLIDSWALPSVGAAQFRIAQIDGVWRLTGFAEPGSTLTFQGSTDLITWTPPFTHVDPPGSTNIGYDMSFEVGNVPRTFYRGSSILYPNWPAHDFSLDHAILQFNYNDDDTFPGNYQLVELFLDFANPGNGGTWSRTSTYQGATSGDFNATYSVVSPFVGKLSITPLSGLNLKPFTFNLYFDRHDPVDTVVIDRFKATAPGESHTGKWNYRFYPN